MDTGWTLSFEFAFYLLVAVMVALGLAKRLTYLAVVMALAGLVGAVVNPRPYIFDWLLNPILLEFVLGIIAYELWGRGWIDRARRAWLAGGLAGACVLAAEAIFGYGVISEQGSTLDSTRSLQRVLLWGLPVFLIFAALLPYGKAPRRDRPTSVPTLLGDASYSIYLVHLPALIVVGTLLDHLHGGLVGADLVLLLSVAAGACAGMAYYMLVERPLTGHLRRFVADRPHKDKRPAQPKLSGAACAGAGRSEHVRVQPPQQRGQGRP